MELPSATGSVPVLFALQLESFGEPLVIGLEHSGQIDRGHLPPIQLYHLCIQSHAQEQISVELTASELDALVHWLTNRTAAVKRAVKCCG